MSAKKLVDTIADLIHSVFVIMSPDEKTIFVQNIKKVSDDITVEDIQQLETQMNNIASDDRNPTILVISSMIDKYKIINDYMTILIKCIVSTDIQNFKKGLLKEPDMSLLDFDQYTDKKKGATRYQIINNITKQIQIDVDTTTVSENIVAALTMELIMELVINILATYEMPTTCHTSMTITDLEYAIAQAHKKYIVIRSN